MKESDHRRAVLLKRARALRRLIQKQRSDGTPTAFTEALLKEVDDTLDLSTAQRARGSDPAPPDRRARRRTRSTR